MKRLRRLGRGFWLATSALCVLTFALAYDFAKPPAQQRSAQFLLAGIDFYQGGPRAAYKLTGSRCRFDPTCSRYAEAVIEDRGALVGGAMSAWRVLRCGPWTKRGTVDPPS